MSGKKKKNIIYSRRFHNLKFFIIINFVLLIANLFSYVFITGPQVLKVKAAEALASLTICAVGGCPAEPEPESVSEAEATTPMGGVPYPVFVPPGIIDQIYPPGEFGIPPYIRVLQVSGKDVVPGQVFQTYVRQPSFLGKTNLKHAVIFLEFSMQPKVIYTTFSDEGGHWGFSSPLYLNIGPQMLYITAMSHADPKVKATNDFYFEVLEIPRPGVETPPKRLKILPSPTPAKTPIPPTLVTPLQKPIISPSTRPIPSPEIIPPILLPPLPPSTVLAPKTIIELEKVYTVDLKVSPESKEVVPMEVLKIKTKIGKLLPDDIPKKVIIKYLVFDEQNQLVFQKEEEILVEDTIEIEKLLKPFIFASPGRYKVMVQLELDDVTYIAVDTFDVKELLPSFIPVIATISSQYDVLSRVGVITFALIFIFCVLLVREKRKSQRGILLSDEDIIDGGFIK